MFSRSRIAVSVLGLLSAVALAQVQLPDAPGKDETVRMCGTCHEVERATAVRLNREGWQDTIAKMVDLGANASDEERAKVLNYLAEHFKGEAPRPLNLNTATAIELESIVGLLRKEAAAWIAYRKTSGPCKSLDDFKKVPGVPFKKIDERRDRLVCF
jgi:competence protein ComEA